MTSRERVAEYLDATTGVPTRADLIFVPGTRLPDPAAIAARLLVENVAPLVLVAGGIKVTGANEAAALRRELLSLGGPSSTDRMCAFRFGVGLRVVLAGESSH